MIVDTSFLLDTIDGVEAAIEKERELGAESIPLVILSMTVTELYIGVWEVATRDERHKIGLVLDSYPLVDLTPSISRRAGRLLGERMAAVDDAEGPGIGKSDAAIAATALERDEPVLAGDSHFGTIPGVTHDTGDRGDHRSSSANASSMTSSLGAFRERARRRRSPSPETAVRFNCPAVSQPDSHRVTRDTSARLTASCSSVTGAGGGSVLI